MIDCKSTSASFAAARNAMLCGLLLVTAAACTTTPVTTRPTDVQGLEARARAAADSGNLTTAAELYAQLAASVTGTLRAGYLIDSARLSTRQGDAITARRRLTDARSDADRDQQQMIVALLAGLEVDQRRAQAALDMLATLQPPLTAEVSSEAAAVRGRALFQLGRTTDAVRVLVDREVWLNDAASILANQRLIWDGFRQFPPPGPLTPTGDRIIDGWLALAPIAATGAEPTELRRELLTWRETYTDHPAAGGLLAELLSAQRTSGFPAQIALLLPSSSPQRNFALAIRDGFMAAYLGSANTASTQVRVYDTAALGVKEAYLRAQLEGADFIVGPLLRQEVDDVSAEAGFVPTLALNFTQNDTVFLRSFYQFALWPEDEASIAADSAVAAGATTAIALVPSTERGYRLLNSFRSEFEARGGQLLDFRGYDPSLKDFSQPIMGLLNITRSNQRERRLQANLGTQVEFEPRRRRDVDAIFIGADDQAGRLLAPQLKFNFAGDIPTYATSDIFTPGNSARDNDLNGVIFTDAPIVLAPSDGGAVLKRQLEDYWPQRTSLVRFYAMGYDAYDLIGSLYNGDASIWPVAGMSGSLSLDAQGRIHRQLSLGQFRDGRPVALEVPPPSAGTGSLVGAR
jgi:uncharacterized protein